MNKIISTQRVEWLNGTEVGKRVSNVVSGKDSLDDQAAQTIAHCLAVPKPLTAPSVLVASMGGVVTLNDFLDQVLDLIVEEGVADNHNKTMLGLLLVWATERAV